jgi:hypothetical protein
MIEAWLSDSGCGWPTIVGSGPHAHTQTQNQQSLQ